MKKRTLLFFMTSLFLSVQLQAQTFPSISDETTDHWYSIYSHRSKKVISNPSLGMLSESNDFLANQDDQQWKFKLTSKGLNAAPDTFLVVSKVGGSLFYIDYFETDPGSGDYIWDADANDGAGGYVKLTQADIDAGVLGTHLLINRFVTNFEQEGTRFVFTTFGKDASGFQFQLFAVDAGAYLNMTNPGDGANYTLYRVNGDSGNPFSVVRQSLDEIEEGLDLLYSALFADAPQLSNADSPVWYQIKNLRKARVFTVNAANAVKLEPAIDEGAPGRDAQLFRFEGSLRSFRIICKAGGELLYNLNTDRIIKTNGQGQTFKIDRMTGGSYIDRLVILHEQQNSGLNGMHSYDICLYDGTFDDGNAVAFTIEGYDPFDAAPERSSDASPIWYWIKNMRSDKVLYYHASAQQLYTGTETSVVGDEQEAQLFRFEGSYTEGLKVIAKLGGEVTYNATSGRFNLADDGSLFTLQPQDESIPSWNILYGNGNGVNAHDVKPEEVVLYLPNDPGSVWKFVRYNGSSNLETVRNGRTISHSFAGHTLTVQAEGMCSIAVYSVTGTLVASASQTDERFTATIAARGYYVLSVTFDDGTVENRTCRF